MKLALPALLVLAACSGPPPTKSTICGSANASCTLATDCCSGFTCIASGCVFIGGNGTGAGASSTAGGDSGGISTSSSGGHGNTGGLIGGGSSNGSGAGSSTGHAIGGQSSGGHGTSGNTGTTGTAGTNAGTSTGGVISTTDLCASCASTANCNSGYDCVTDENGASYCAPDCSSGTCPAAAPCNGEPDVANPFNDDLVCYPASGSCGAGTSSGGTTGGGTTGGGCTETSIDPTEFASCPTTACGVGLDCVTDPFVPDTYCEYPCTTAANCPDPLTACFSGTCTNPICAPIDTSCAFGSGRGTCYGLQVDGGFCAPAGSLAVGATCGSATTCSGASEACVQGSVCSSADGFTYACYELCVLGSTCSNGSACTSLGDGINGYCP
jgi:hypothetical protein